MRHPTTSFHRRLAAPLLLCGALLMIASCYQLAGYDDFSFHDPPPGDLLLRLTDASVEKIDLLLVIDNSRSMADKQLILHKTLREWVGALVNPKCRNADGAVAPDQPAGPLDPCPGDSAREVPPVLDIHIGIVSSSLGGLGADLCDAVVVPSENDHGHLIARADVDNPGSVVPTYNDLGFLAWDPAAQHTPPGEASFEQLIDNLETMVLGVGEIGCGFEAPLEAWYRFLVDPEPYQSISIEEDGNATLVGTDEVLLRQRRDFLRPESLLIIAMISDENDCSIRTGGQYWWLAQAYPIGSTIPYRLPKPTPECATDPSDPCCYSCGQETPEGCPPPGAECNGSLTVLEDPINLRCFDTKRRFGFDALQPIDRYVTGLTSPVVPDRLGQLVDNPIFSQLEPADEGSLARRPDWVMLAGIVGVPWQDLARRDASDQPDLLTGLNGDGDPVGGFQSAAEMNELGTWSIIIGDPASGTPPQDPFMIESVEPREGNNPITGDPILPPGVDLNAINGHEYDAPEGNDLQHACVFTGKDCDAVSGEPDCRSGLGGACEDISGCEAGLICDGGMCGRDCNIPGTFCDCPSAESSFLCQDREGNFVLTQYRAKGYPGIRPLQVLQGLGDQGIVGSICPAQLNDPQAPDYGYQPAIGAIFERLTPERRQTFCLPQSRSPGEDGTISCTLIEARATAEECRCEQDAREMLDVTEQALVPQLKSDPLYATAQWNCYCKIPQVTGPYLAACRDSTDPRPTVEAGYPVDGWCYIDEGVGEPEIMSNCDPEPRRGIRTVGAGLANAEAALFFACR